MQLVRDRLIEEALAVRLTYSCVMVESKLDSTPAPKGSGHSLTLYSLFCSSEARESQALPPIMGVQRV